MGVNKKLAAINTIVSYLRTILNVGLSLFTVRWIMRALGEQDYGLYFLVGGIVACLSFISMSLQASSTRYFSCSMDRDICEIQKWFSASVFLHLGCALLVLLASVPTYFISFRCFFVIPVNRVMACKLVYWCAAASMCVSILNVPFASMYVAKQRIFELTILQITNGVMLFVFAYCLLELSGDRLIIYAVGVFLVNVIICTFQGIRCLSCFKEARILRFVSIGKDRFLSILSFSWLSLLDTLSYMLRGQGVQIVFNRFGSAGLNASYSVANQLSTQTNVLAAAVVSALSPGIMAQYGNGDIEGAGIWCVRTCKISTVLALMAFIPIYVECPYLMDLWLTTQPTGCVEFVRAMAITYLITKFVTGGNILIRAQGEIGAYTRWTALSYLSALPVAAGIVFLGFDVKWVIYSFVISTIGYAIVTLVRACALAGFSFREWSCHVLGAGLILLIIGFVCALGICSIMPQSFIRVVLIVFVNASILIAGALGLMLKVEERDFVLNKVRLMLIHRSKRL